MRLPPVIWAALLTSCSHSPSAPTTSPVPPTCRPPADRVAAARTLQADGYLGRALIEAEAAVAGCDDRTTSLLLAEILADIGLDQRAITAYRDWAQEGSAAERARVAEILAELERRPNPSRKTSPAEQQKALLLYRDGVGLRAAGDYPLALKQLRRSYSLHPHPLTIVQIALVHQAGGDEIEYRKANARALAIAEAVAGTSARLVIRPSHAGEIHQVEVTADGRLVLSTDQLGEVKIWEAATGRELFSDRAERGLAATGDNGRAIFIAREDGIEQLDGASFTTLMEAATSSPVVALAAAAKSPVVVAGHQNGDVSRWPSLGDSPTSAPVCQASFGQPARVVIAETGKIAVVTCSNGPVVVWGADGSVDELPMPNSAVAVALDPAGDRLVISTVESLSVWDTRSRSQLIVVEQSATAIGLAISANGLLAGWSHNQLVLRDLATLEQLRTIALDQDRFARAASFSSNGRDLVTATEQAALRWWDSETGEHIRAFGGNATVDLIAFHPTATPPRIAIGGSGGKAWIWNLGAAERPFMFQGTNRGLHVTGIGFVLGGDGLMIGERVTGLLGYDAIANQLHLLELDPKPFITNQLANPHGGDTVLFATGGRLQYLRLATLAEMASKHQLTELGQRAFRKPNSLVISNDNQKAAWGEAGGVAVWELEKNRELMRIPLATAPLAFDPAATGLATTSPETGEVKMWTVGQPQPTRRLAISGEVAAVTFLTDGSLATATRAGEIAIWSQAPQPVVKIAAGANLTAVEGSPDGSWIASAHADGTLRLWSKSDGRPIATLLVTPDEKWLVTVGDRVVGTAGSNLLYWQVGELQLPGFVGWQRNHAPALLEEIVASAGVAI